MFALVGAILAPQGLFAPDARYSWVVSALNQAHREGLITGYPDDSYLGQRNGQPSRYVYAILFHAVISNQIAREEVFLKRPGGDVERSSLLRFAEAIPSYRRAAREFRSEYLGLGVGEDIGIDKLFSLTRQIDATSAPRHRPFRDVPADHWAAKAVGDLRALGMIQGYPSGRFQAAESRP